MSLVSRLSSWTYFATSRLWPVCPLSCGYWLSSWSLFARLRLNRFGLSCTSSTPGSQYSIRMLMLLMLISPSPPRAAGSQNTPFTPVPVLSLRHQVSL